MGISRKSAIRRMNNDGDTPYGDKADSIHDAKHPSKRKNENEGVDTHLYSKSDDTPYHRTSLSVHGEQHSYGQSDSQTIPPTTSILLGGDLTTALPPSPLLTLLEDCTLTNLMEDCTPTSPPRGIRMLLSLRRDRTPPPSAQSPPSHSLSGTKSYTDDAEDGNEIFGDMVPEPSCSHGAVYPFAALGGFTDQPNAVLAAEANIDDELDEYDDDNSLVGSSECVGTTTGASFGRRTNPTSPQSSQSTALFGRQHYCQMGRGLFDSVETTAPWDIAPLLNGVQPPTADVACLSVRPVVLSDSCFPTNEDQ